MRISDWSSDVCSSDLKILILARFDAALRRELVDLALRDHRRGVGQDLEHLQRPVLDHQFERAGKQEIADKHRGAVAPDQVRGLAAAAKVGAVDDIVEEQRRGVEEFNRGGELAMAARRLAEKRSTERRGGTEWVSRRRYGWWTDQ